MPTSPKQPYGILVPITHGSSGFFEQSFTVLDQIKSNLKLLLNTRKGERRMNPTFGTDLYSVIFEQNVDGISSIIESVVRRDVSAWMPYLNVVQVLVDANPTYRDTYTAVVQVLVTVASLGITDAQSVDFTLSQPTI